MRHAIVIGGSSGMGKGAAKHWVDQGGSVTICSRSEEKMATAKDYIGGPEGCVKTAVLDNTDEESVKQVKTMPKTSSEGSDTRIHYCTGIFFQASKVTALTP